MRKVELAERPGWRATAQQEGFAFHTLDGERYWDERGYYQFSQAQVELTYNWDPEVYTGGRNFGHLAYAVDDIYATCERLQSHGVTINRPPRDGYMAFVRSPDNISIELLQRGDPLPPRAPWVDMPNVGSW